MQVLDNEGNECPAGTEGDIGVRVKPERPVGLFYTLCGKTIMITIMIMIMIMIMIIITITITILIMIVIMIISICQTSK